MFGVRIRGSYSIGDWSRDLESESDFISKELPQSEALGKESEDDFAQIASRPFALSEAEPRLLSKLRAALPPVGGGKGLEIRV